MSLKECSCIIDKAPQRKTRAPMQYIETQSPFQLVGIDFLHLEKSKWGYECVSPGRPLHKVCTGLCNPK